MVMGATCPGCGKKTFHDEGGHRVCSKCGYVGWPAGMAVTDVSSGKGNSCPNCQNQTLHCVAELPTGQRVRRCSTCYYSAIDPAGA